MRSAAISSLTGRWVTVANVWRLVRRECGWWLWPLLGLQLALSAVTAVELLAARTLLGHFDQAQQGGPVPTFALAALSAAIAVGVLVGSLSPMVQELCANLVDKGVRKPLILAAATMSLENLDRPDVHNRIHHVLDADSEVSLMLLHGLAGLVRDLATFAVAFAFIVALYPPMLLVLPLAVLPTALAARMDAGVRRQLWEQEEVLTRERTLVSDMVRDRAIGGELRMYAMAGPLARRDGLLAEQRRVLLMRLLKREGMRSLAVGLVRAAAVPAVVWMLVNQVRTGGLRPQDAVILAVAGQQAFARMAGVRTAAVGLDRQLHTLEHFDELVALSTTTPAVQPVTIPSLLTVLDVSFTYPGNDVATLHEVSFTARPGEVLAVVGGNGSGKSTVFALLAGLRTPTLGSVGWSATTGAPCAAPIIGAVIQPHARVQLRIDQILDPARSWDPAQSPPNNAHTFTDEELNHALQTVGLGAAVARFPHGLAQRIGAEFGGTELSAGQWQRLVLARALLCNAPVVLLDEPGSSLDPAAEAQLIDLLRAQCRDRFVIMSSHRASSIVKADRVVVLHEGRVVEVGCPQHLLEHGTALRSLLAMDALAPPPGTIIEPSSLESP